MGLAQINHEFPSPAGRFLLLTTKVINLTLLSKDYPIFFLDAANLEINPFPFFSSRFVEDLLTIGRSHVIFSTLNKENKAI
jgi:hypothetical protein